MKTVAFYLPQFHQIPENDEWWGSGFTEWRNVARARPQFHGHKQPRRPTVLGEYDLLDASIPQRQTELASMYGIDAFCMYFYWFEGRRLLERPVEHWRQTPTLLPYFLCWANEPWTRRWDGKNREVLMAQTYLESYETRLFADLLPHFHASHYQRHRSKPILVVHRADQLPEPTAFAGRLRDLALEAGLPGLYLIAAETSPGLVPHQIGFDAVAEFPPVGANTLRSAQLSRVPGLSTSFRGRLLSYDRLMRRYQNRPQPTFDRYHGVMPGWDNTARRQSKATIYVGAEPKKYAAWLAWARAMERSIRGSTGMVFVNAWNEWAEGAYLEPDLHHGTAYLRATQPGSDPPRSRLASKLPPAGVPNFAQLRGLGLLAIGSVVAAVRRLRNRMGP